MRFILSLLPLLFLGSQAAAQAVVPLTTPDGRVGCTQGKTGIGRAAAWEAVADPDGPNGWSLVETAADATDQRFPLCIYEPATARDFDATLRFKPVSGTHDQVAGFMFRAQSANDYYVVRASARDNSVRLYRMDKGKRSQLAMREAPVTLGQWHSLRVIAVSDRIEVALDGKTLFEVTDRTLMQPGPVGVWSQGDSVTHYGSLLIGPPPAR